MNVTKNIFGLSKIRSLLSRHFSVKYRIANDAEHLEVAKDNATQSFPLVWLRDNCRCEACYHDASSSRILNWDRFNPNIKTRSVQSVDGNRVLVVWEDGHESLYDYEWLEQRSFAEENQERYLAERYRPKRKLWSKNDFFEILRPFQYKDVINNDAEFYKWFRDLSVYGVALIKNAPTIESESVKLVEKVAFIKKTHYGEAFHIRNKPDTQNVAYLSDNLQLHTDLPYYHYTPGTTLLHCIVQTESQGGDNLLADAFYVAEKLRRENQEAFDILSSVLVDWSDVGQEDGIKFNKIYRSPVIRLDDNKNISTVRHSVPQRDSHFTTNLKNVKPWYKALRIFIDDLNADAAKFKLDPGDILAFDNTRLVHGRLAYKDTDKSHRFLVGMYLDWDEIYSAMRVVKKDLGLCNDDIEHFKQ